MPLATAAATAGSRSRTLTSTRRLLRTGEIVRCSRNRSITCDCARPRRRARRRLAGSRPNGIQRVASARSCERRPCGDASKSGLLQSRSSSSVSWRAYGSGECCIASGSSRSRPALVDHFLERHDVRITRLDEQTRPRLIDRRRRERVHGSRHQHEQEHGGRRPSPLVDHTHVVEQVDVREHVLGGSGSRAGSRRGVASRGSLIRRTFRGR